MKKQITKKTIMKMLIAGIAALTLLIVVSPIAFFVSIGSEWQTRKEIKGVRASLDVDASKSSLASIAQNDRILEVIAVDSNGDILYTIKGMTLFADTNATVLYDQQTGLIKFDGARVSYFQRNSILGALLELDDDDDFDFDDDDDKKPTFDYRFVEDNTFQTIALDDARGNTVYIVCTQNDHVGFIVYLVLLITAWSILLAYFVAIVGYVIYKRCFYVACPACAQHIWRSNKHCTKCGSSLEPKRCNACGAQAKKGDLACGKCGNKLEE